MLPHRTPHIRALVVTPAKPHCQKMASIYLSIYDELARACEGIARACEGMARACEVIARASDEWYRG
jgi:hypothetical protein